ncbi:hypothetical protein Pyrfu_1590 [Pyrolobus fumarii 1A]|uniref:Uncharacterized protein n=2 Tax=Pyrolobus fumarii TaxID=54252 RepID=G0EC77_PYRF1|nr:hypothetical protein Pyrfu_1590 [Pyrolobus fumarii 1A]
MIALALLFAYMAYREHHEDPLWSLIYLLISIEYGLDMIAIAKPKKVVKN